MSLGLTHHLSHREQHSNLTGSWIREKAMEYMYDVRTGAAACAQVCTPEPSARTCIVSVSHVYAALTLLTYLCVHNLLNALLHNLLNALITSTWELRTRPHVQSRTKGPTQSQQIGRFENALLNVIFHESVITVSHSKAPLPWTEYCRGSHIPMQFETLCRLVKMLQHGPTI